MAALLGATVETARDACTAMPEACWLANDNAPGQVVIAGTPEGLEAGVARAKELGVRKAMPLNVGGAFHTPLMQDAADALESELAGLDLSAAAAPVVANDDGQAHGDGGDWRLRSARHVAVPVRWREAQLTLAELGATSLIEVGHGSMLAALAKRTVPDVTVIGLSTPEDLATVAAATASAP
jgi:[acyl-carrier-protein] S-malonyltransferase